MKHKVSIPASNFNAQNYLAAAGFTNLPPLLISAVEAYGKAKADQEKPTHSADMDAFERAESYSHPHPEYVQALDALDGIKNVADKEIWLNSIYQVEVRRGIEISDGIKVVHLSIKRRDKKAIIDWRHFQWIKNELVGPENEGVELFPAENRLVDGANQYHIWVFEDPQMRFPFGFTELVVAESGLFGETQRAFPKSRRPQDIEACEQKIKKAIDVIVKEHQEQK